MRQPLRDLTPVERRMRAGSPLAGDPLAFIHQAHLREREICTALDRIAAAPTPEGADVSEALRFLRDALPVHWEDEEQDLFPLLRRRCVPEDDIPNAIARLCDDHRRAARDLPTIVAILAALAAGRASLSRADREALSRFAACARRHLIFENAIVLPFARFRLTERDRETLRLRMGQRRGQGQSTGTPDAG